MAMSTTGMTTMRRGKTFEGQSIQSLLVSKDEVSSSILNFPQIKVLVISPSASLNSLVMAS